MKNSIVLIDYSGIFPDSIDENDFFHHLLSSHILIKKISGLGTMPHSHLNLDPHYSKNQYEENKTYSLHGSYLDRKKIEGWGQSLGLDKDSSLYSEIICHKLLDNIFKQIPRASYPDKIDMVIAPCFGNPNHLKKFYKKNLNQLKIANIDDEKLYQLEGILEIENLSSFFTTKEVSARFAFESARKKYALNGACILTEAACASSVASIYVGINRINSHLTDAVIVGGIGLELNLFSMIGFSKVGILSPDILKPFNKGTNGTNPGEAAAFFVLMRESEAIKRGLPIKCIINNCGASSDGALGGLVEPTEEGQILAYQRAYDNFSNPKLNYIEAHGTGTALGDKTEVNSIREFFGPDQKIGTVKANVGHTIFAAGATSLIKCVKMLETNLIPPLPIADVFEYGQDMCFRDKTQGQVPLDDKNGKKIIGISSFGFGGSNFHFSIESYEAVMSNGFLDKKSKAVVCAEKSILFSEIDELFLRSSHKIPPISLPQMDKTILGALVLTEKLFKDEQIRLNDELKLQLGVIATVDSYLERARYWLDRCVKWDILRHATEENRDQIKSLFGSDSLNISEDSVPGCLSNLISGRITKAYDFKGPNFSLNDEKNSHWTGVETAISLVKNNSGAFIVVSVIQDFSEDGQTMEPALMTAHLISEQNFAINNELPILYEIDFGSRRLLAESEIKEFRNDYI